MANTTKLGRGYDKARKEGGGVVPGAHPEMENRPVGPANPFTVIRDLMKKRNEAEKAKRGTQKK